MTGVVVYTVGHGNRTGSELIGLLREAGVHDLVDVRAHPGSRRHPQFSRGSLEQDLPAAGIRYLWEGAALGGRRRPRPDSPHVGWRNDSFRAYADYMESPEFAAGVERVTELARADTTAIMCAERLPWQCHRYLIADFLVSRGVDVVHLIGPGAAREHQLNPMARLEGDRLIYDRISQLDLGLGDAR